MKKNIFKILGFVFVAALVLTGCATVSNITNEREGELLFNGGNSVVVGDYLYYANGYAQVGSAATDYDYAGNAAKTYINRINLKKDVSTYKLDAPKSSEKFNSRVAGFENQYMFVIDNYIYFTSPNQHKTNNLNNDYCQVSFFRAKLNGDEERELFTSEHFPKTGDSSSSKPQMRVLKGSDGEYYWIVFDGTDLISIKVGKNVGAKQLISTNVTSVAMPKENSDYKVNKIFYTTGSGEEVKAYVVDYATGDKKPVSSIQNGTKFIDRINDTIIYQNDTPHGANQTYYVDVSKTDAYAFSGDDGEEFFSEKGISKVYQTSQGYVFLGKAGNLVYKNTNTGKEGKLADSGKFTEILFVNNDVVYLSTADGISYVKEGQELRPIVSVSGIVSGEYSYYDHYIYFYAGLQTDENDEVKYQEDNNVYLYRVHEDGEQPYQILSKYTREEVKE